MSGDLVLAIDQGTGSTRAIAFDSAWRPIAHASRPLETIHPRPGWAEQDPLAILASVVDAVAEVLLDVGGPARIGAVGLDNQGETVVAWDRVSGEPLAPAILWNCRRSQSIVDRVAAAGHGPAIRDLTGLPLDPYFSASKMRWLIENVEPVAAAERAGRLALGTVDAWLTARLGGSARTDPSTASRTQLLGLRSLAWEDELAGWWQVPRSALAVVGPTVGDLGSLTHPIWGGDLLLRAMACDQQAALAGQGGHRRGTVKATFGTGVFVLANAGSQVPPAVDGLLTTVAWTDAAGRPTYALDGGVFSAGALLGWLAGDIGLLDAITDLDAVAAEVVDAGGVRILPALGGLGAPWWEPRARAVIAGLTGATRRAHVARAAIDAIAHRTADVVEAMLPALASRRPAIRIDGGLTASRLLVERLADLTGCPVEVAAEPESTALGIGLLAAIGAGWLDEARAAVVAATDRRVDPVLDERARLVDRAAWRAFVPRAVALEMPEADPAAGDDRSANSDHPPAAARRTAR
ncbi:MAG TPA: FGGY family carbohydrate kinase [Patescibacteria group bacterium]|nr:FGGY family carbohydrate kinase [Patescibacteria group bacterium]